MTSSCVVTPATRAAVGWVGLKRNLVTHDRDLTVEKVLEDPGPCDAFQEINNISSRPYLG